MVPLRVPRPATLDPELAAHGDDPRGTSRWRILAVASTASFLVYLDVTVVNIAFPNIEAGFPGASRAGLAWVLAAYNIAFAALLVPGGRIGDRFGRRRLFLIGLAGFAASSAACALAPSAEALVAARIVQAVAGALLVPASQGLVLDAFEMEQRTTAMSLWVAAGAVAAALGPPLGGVIVDLADWRWVFVINVPIGAGVFAYGLRILRESRDPTATRFPDPLGILLAAASIGLLVLGIVQGQNWGWGSPAVLGSFVGAALLLPAFVVRTRASAAPALDLDLFRSRSFSLANVASMLIGVAFYGQLFAAVLFLTTVWGYSPIEAGLALVPAPLAAAVAATIGGRWAETHPLVPLALTGIGLFAAGALWLWLALDFEPAYLTAFLPGTILVGAGGGLGVSMLTSAAARVLPPESFAAGGAVNSATRQIGAALGVATVVAIVGRPSPAEAVSAFAGGWAAIGAFALAALLVTAAIPGEGLGARGIGQARAGPPK